MNKEQIAKHGDVIIWFATGNNADKGVWFKQNNSDWVRTTNPTFNVGNYDFIYVQNDEYAELRMAQADGKVIQYNAHCHPNSSGIWRRDTELNWYLPVKQYRIKPDEPEFKAGDWVKDKDNYIYQWNEYKHKECKLWEPQEREWCVFWNSKHMHYAIGQYFQTQGNNDYMKFGDLSSYNNIAPLKFAQTLKAKS